MARPAKAIKTATGARTKEEIALRTGIEEQLRGDGGTPAPPDWLTENQAAVFRLVVAHCEAAGILTGVDAQALTQFCVAVDRLQTIEEMVNGDTGLLFDAKLMSARSGYERTLWRGCNEFCLSPQARAKIGSLAAGARKEAADPLMEAMSADGGEGRK